MIEPAAADRDRTRLLAEDMSGLACEALAPEDVEQVKRLLLDHVGVAWRGSDMPWSRALADRVDSVADDAMQAAFPAHFGSWVELAAVDGARRRTEVLDSRGTPARPLAADAIAGKIEGLLAAMEDAPEVADLVDAVWSLDEPGGLERLTRLLRPRADA